MDINSLILFKNVADFHSFTAAAHHVGLPKSVVSQRISLLEQDLGVRLLRRTTRRVGLTEVGERIYQAAATIAEQRDVVKVLSEESAETIAGTLNVSLPPDLGVTLLSSFFGKFLADHPGIRMRLDLSTRFVDLVQEGVDIALRASLRGLQDSSLVAQKICALAGGIYANPELASIHAIAHPDALNERQTISFGRGAWHLQNQQTAITLNPAARIVVNDYQGALAATIAGLGYCLLPDEICKDSLRHGDLVRVLPDWMADMGVLYAVYPEREFIPRKTAAFLAALKSFAL